KWRAPYLIRRVTGEQSSPIGRRSALYGSPVRAARDRRARRIARHLQPIDAARDERLLPVVVHIRQQHPDARHRRVDIAVDGTRIAAHGVLPSASLAPCALNAALLPSEPVRP